MRCEHRPETTNRIQIDSWSQFCDSYVRRGQSDVNRHQRLDDIDALSLLKSDSFKTQFPATRSVATAAFLVGFRNINPKHTLSVA